MSALEGRVAVITGASRGIGAAIARALHEAGASVGLGSRSGDDLGLEGAYAARCDVRHRSEVEALVEGTAERFGQLDIVVANAGVGHYGPFAELSPEALDEMVDVNLKGTLYTVAAGLPQLLRSDAPDVVAIASEAGRHGFAGEAVYCASKFGQVGFMRALDVELHEHGIRCTSICPGGVATDFAMGTGRTPGMPELEGMMSAQDVAEITLFALTRSRNHRILETAIRPAGEPSSG